MITLPNGDVLSLGDQCRALVDSDNPSKWTGGRRWRKAIIVEILKGGGVDRAVVEVKNGNRFFVGRYNLEKAP